MILKFFMRIDLPYSMLEFTALVLVAAAIFMQTLPMGYLLVEVENKIFYSLIFLLFKVKEL